MNLRYANHWSAPTWVGKFDERSDELPTPPGFDVTHQFACFGGFRSDLRLLSQANQALHFLAQGLVIGRVVLQSDTGLR